MDFPSLRWNIAQRFLFLEQRLFWEGRINKGDLVRRFAISIPQATSDVAHYEKAAPGNLRYDNRLKAFVPSSSFAPKFLEPDARQYLSQLLLLADRAMSPSDTWIGTVPSHDAIPRIRRRLNVSILQPLVRAIHTRKALYVTYQSMSSPEPTRRWIAPHALAFSGARWHVRAWCFRRSTFVDFVLARLLSIDGDRQADIDDTLDREWHEFVDVQIAPHPNLSAAQRAVIALDYGMTDECVSVPIRLALYYYFERNLCLDIENLAPERQQVIVVNKADIEARRGDHSANL